MRCSMSEATSVVRVETAAAMAVTPSASQSQGPREVSFDGIHSIVRQPDLPMLARHQLIRQETRAVCERRKNQIDVALQVSRREDESRAKVALAALKKYETELLLEIEQSLTTTLASQGIRVEMDKLNLFRDFA